MTDRAPVLLVRAGAPAALPDWQAAFAQVRPDIHVRGWNDPKIDPADVRFVVVWEPEPGRIAGYPNLRAIFSTAAGVDHITRDPTLPAHLPIVRMAADEMAQTVGEYVSLAALMILRDAPRLIAAKQAGRWDPFRPARTAFDTRIGLLGLGWIGQHTAGMLRGLGFQVQGWSRSRKDVGSEVRSFAGQELDEFLATSDILVGILPDTPETRGLLTSDRLARLPRGAGLINAGRGTLFDEADLLAALNDGQIGLAVLDVFAVEPLPQESRLWQHPLAFVTSHVAGYASIPARARSVAAAIASLEANLPPANLYDADRGY